MLFNCSASCHSPERRGSINGDLLGINSSNLRNESSETLLEKDAHQHRSPSRFGFSSRQGNGKWYSIDVVEENAAISMAKGENRRVAHIT